MAFGLIEYLSRNTNIPSGISIMLQASRAAFFRCNLHGGLVINAPITEPLHKLLCLRLILHTEIDSFGHLV